jgi:hypothetical protein
MNDYSGQIAKTTTTVIADPHYLTNQQPSLMEKPS